MRSLPHCCCNDDRLVTLDADGSVEHTHTHTFRTRIVATTTRINESQLAAYGTVVTMLLALFSQYIYIYLL